jgi:broad specificity phosphatase PhoE
MAIVYFITHPDVVIDALVPVPAWPLSSWGFERIRQASGQLWLREVQSIFSSAERKATDTAGVLATALGVNPVVLDGLGENDRSSTGYLPRDTFEAHADAFFASPEKSVSGWECAIDAQSHIILAVEQAIAIAPVHGDIAVVSHGGVGTLLLCHLKGLPISRDEDQPRGGGGNVFAFERDNLRLLWGWRQIEHGELRRV